MIQIRRARHVKCEMWHILRSGILIGLWAMLFCGQNPSALGASMTHIDRANFRQSKYTLETILSSCSTQTKTTSTERGREGVRETEHRDSTLSSRLSSRRWSTACLKPLKKSYSMLIWQTKCWNFWDNDNDNDKLSSHQIWMGSIEGALKRTDWSTAAANKMWRSNCCRHLFAYVTADADDALKFSRTANTYIQFEQHLHIHFTVYGCPYIMLEYLLRKCKWCLNGRLPWLKQ